MFFWAKGIMVVFLVIGLVLIAPLARAEEASQSEREAMYYRYLEFRSLLKGGSIEPHWMADGSSFWYAEGAPDKTGIQGRFLQGLIQASACHLKRLVRHTKGVERLRRTSLGYLRAIVDKTTGAPFMGLDLVAFVRDFEAYYHTCGARSEMTLDHDSRAYPYLRLDGPGPYPSPFEASES